MKRLPFHFSFLAFGISTLTIQIILVRELLVIFSGNELSIGLFLSQWLVAQAIGSFIYSRIRLKTGNQVNHYNILFTFFTATFPAIIFAIRIIKTIFGIIPGEQVSFLILAVISFFILLIPGILGGALFSLGCRIYATQHEHSVKNISWVYLIEAAGFLTGGMLVSNIGIRYLYPFQIAFAIILTGLVACTWLSVHIHGIKHARSRIYSLALLVPFIFWITGGVEYLHTTSLSLQWQPYTIKDYHNTVYGNVVTLEKSGQLDILMSGIPAAHFPTPEITKVEELAHLAMLSHRAPKHVLLLGNGIDGVIPEILKHPLTHLDYIESDSVMLVRLSEIFSRDIIFTADNRLKTIFMDGRTYLNITRNKYDVMILNLSEPSTLNINRFYTREFFELCKQHLLPSGNLIFSIPSGTTYLNQPARQLNAALISTARSVFRHSQITPGENTVIILSDEILNLSKPELWNLRLSQRKIDTRIIKGNYFELKLDTLRLNWYTNELRDVSFKTNLDLHPAAVWYSLSLWITVNQPEFWQVVNIIENINLIHIAGLIFIITIIFLVLPGKTLIKKNRVIYAPVFTTGFAGLSLSVLLALLFQAYHGYIYAWLGYLVAAFMAGLGSGTWFFGIYLPGSRVKRLLLLELCFVCMLGIMLAILSFDFSSDLFMRYKIMILGLAIAGGFLVGGEFPLLAALKSGHEQTIAPTAGRIYAMDLLGAGFGGILTSAIFIPVLGIKGTLYLLIVLKLSSGVLVMRCRQKIDAT